ncbi:MAG: hypothetical protein EBS52_09075, partial [Betaproteobacteria bacterium]|nr:hypothetical protein [Betaproteobacteria bacterium]
TREDSESLIKDSEARETEEARSEQETRAMLERLDSKHAGEIRLLQTMKDEGIIPGSERDNGIRTLRQQSHTEVMPLDEISEIPRQEYHKTPEALEAGERTGLQHLGIQDSTKRVIRGYKRGVNPPDGVYLHSAAGLITVVADRDRPLPSRGLEEEPELKAQHTPEGWRRATALGEYYIQHPKARQAIDRPLLEDIDNNTIPQSAVDAEWGEGGLCLLS